MIFMCLFLLELKVAMRALGFDIRKAEVIKLMNEYDSNKTGQIQYADFAEIMTQKVSRNVSGSHLIYI